MSYIFAHVLRVACTVAYSDVFHMLHVVLTSDASVVSDDAIRFHLLLVFGYPVMSLFLIICHDHCSIWRTNVYLIASRIPPGRAKGIDGSTG